VPCGLLLLMVSRVDLARGALCTSPTSCKAGEMHKMHLTRPRTTLASNQRLGWVICRSDLLGGVIGWVLCRTKALLVWHCRGTAWVVAGSTPETPSARRPCLGRQVCLAAHATYSTKCFVRVCLIPWGGDQGMSYQGITVVHTRWRMRCASISYDAAGRRTTSHFAPHISSGETCTRYLHHGVGVVIPRVACSVHGDCRFHSCTLSHGLCARRKWLTASCSVPVSGCWLCRTHGAALPAAGTGALQGSGLGEMQWWQVELWFARWSVVCGCHMCCFFL
jgi:hypothetical protein